MAYTIRKIAGSPAIIITTNQLVDFRETGQLVRQVESLLRHHSTPIYIILDFDDLQVPLKDFVSEFTALQPYLKSHPPLFKGPRIQMLGITKRRDTKFLRTQLGSIAENDNDGMKRFTSMAEALSYIQDSPLSPA